MSHSFDPNKAAPSNSGIFGLSHSYKDSQLIYLPVPWEATTSYGGGTSQGPSAILEASRQVDLFDLDVERPYEAGLNMLPESQEIQELNDKAKPLAQKIIESAGQPEPHPELEHLLETVNQMGDRVNLLVYQQTRDLLQQGKIVGVVGGDHSVPFGALQAVGEKWPEFGILHFDAHSDTRAAYEGFTWSHASIMYNVMQNIPQVIRLIQVGIRDICEEEVNFNLNQPERIRTFYDRTLYRRKLEGEKWSQIAEDIVSQLPKKVWVSFDIDGLDPRFCPHTGTPVPGGLDFNEANYLLSVLIKSGKEIIGFDLNEVAPDVSNPNDDWDANVGARLLYKLSGWTLASQKKAKVRT